MRFKVVVAGIVAVMFFSSCSKNQDVKDGAISVNGEWITNSDVNQMAEMIRQEYLRFSPEKIFDGASDVFRRNAAKQLIANILMRQEASKRSIDVSDDQFNKMFDDFIKGRFGSREKLSEILEKTGQTEDLLKKQFRGGMIVDSLVKIILADVEPVTDSECLAYYNSNPNSFKRQPRARASQIFFKVDKNTTPEAFDKIKKKLLNLAKKARNGADFAKLARENSQGPNASKGGDIGWFKHGDMLPAIDNAVEKLKKGQVSGVIESEAGLHIFKKTDEESAKTATYEEVKTSLLRNLDLRKRNEVMNKFIDGLMASAKIVYADTTLEDTAVVPN